MRSCESTTCRSAVPLPCAIQVPEHARMMGSSAVTMPLAGTWTTGPDGPVLWMYGSRFETMNTSGEPQMIAHHLLQRLRRPVLVEIDFQTLACVSTSRSTRRICVRIGPRIRVPNRASSRKRRPRMSPTSSFDPAPDEQPEDEIRGTARAPTPRCRPPRAHSCARRTGAGR